MFLVGIHAVITTPERELCIIRILKPKILCIGCTFQKISILIEPYTVGQISDVVLLANLFECLLILRSQGSLVDTGFPAKETLVGFLKSLHPIRTHHINRFFRLHPKSKDLFIHARVAGKSLIDRSTSKFQILFKLITGNKQGSTNRIKTASPAVRRKRINGKTHTRQRLDGIVIFPTVETTHRNLSTGIGKFFTGQYHGLGKILQEVSFSLLFRLTLVFGGHLPGIHCVQNLLPQLRLLQGIHLQGQIFQVYLSFLCFRIVTIHAVGIKQIEMLFRHDGFGLICSDRGNGQPDRGQQKDYFGFHA